MDGYAAIQGSYLFYRKLELIELRGGSPFTLSLMGRSRSYALARSEPSFFLPLNLLHNEHA